MGRGDREVVTMSLLYGVMKESHPPTAVHCSASGAFTDAEEQNVLVARGSTLEIMALRRKPGAEEGEGEGEGEGVLEVIGRYDMFGIIECMELVSGPLPCPGLLTRVKVAIALLSSSAPSPLPFALCFPGSFSRACEGLSDHGVSRRQAERCRVGPRQQ